MSDSNGAALTMELREERFMQFKAGDVIEGVLMKIDRVTMGTPPKPAIRYTVKDDDGNLIAFNGTYQLNSKLLTQDRGHRIRVKYIGENAMVKRGENCMREFEVHVSKELATTSAFSAGNDLGITDDDIPF